MNDTSQLQAWRGEFGDAYVERSLATEARIRKRTFMWANVLKSIQSALPRSVIEVGANVGTNIRALKNLIDANYFAVEPNEAARRILATDAKLPPEQIFASHAGSIPLPDGHVEMGVTRGVLIHIPPGELLQACTELHRVCNRYVACIEYFADQPETVDYRGHANLLFKRDFGAFWLENFSDLRVIDYGFFWRAATGFDNLTWWLFSKR